MLGAYGFVLLMLAVGLTIPLQAGLNAQLARAVTNPFFASLVSFSVGTLSLFLLLLPGLWTGNGSWPGWDKIGGTSWWMWLGGIFGAFFVTATVIAVPRLGAATTLGMVVAGQMVASMAFDHFGLLGFPQHPVSWIRIAGVILLLVGGFLIQRF